MALYGMMTALAFLFGYVESLIPIHFGAPGVKLGLANLAAIVSLYLLGGAAAAGISLVRVILTGFTFGNLSMMLYGLAGAALSLLVMSILKKTDRFGCVGVSVAGGAAHNIGQIAVACLVLESASLLEGSWWNGSRGIPHSCKKADVNPPDLCYTVKNGISSGRSARLLR